MDRGKFTPVGWIAPTSKLSQDGWLQTGATIAALERATPWFWADWWLARGIGDQLPADWTGPEQRTLDNYASVARRFPVSRRRESVSFAHHVELAALPPDEQEEWLDWCNKPSRPSVKALRLERRRRADKPLPGPSSPPTPSLPPPVPASSPPPPALLPVVPPITSAPAETVANNAIEELNAALNAAAIALGREAVIAHLRQWITEPH
jgi:hypothetical protein